MIRWYDYLIILIFADFGQAMILSILLGSSNFLSAVIELPLFVLIWFSYEDLRLRMEDNINDAE